MIQPTFPYDEAVQLGGFAQGRKGGGQKKGVGQKLEIYTASWREFLLLVAKTI